MILLKFIPAIFLIFSCVGESGKAPVKITKQRVAGQDLNKSSNTEYHENSAGYDTEAQCTQKTSVNCCRSYASGRWLPGASDPQNPPTCAAKTSANTSVDNSSSTTGSNKQCILFSKDYQTNVCKSLKGNCNAVDESIIFSSSGACQASNTNTNTGAASVYTGQICQVFSYDSTVGDCVVTGNRDCSRVNGRTQFISFNSCTNSDYVTEAKEAANDENKCDGFAVKYDPVPTVVSPTTAVCKSERTSCSLVADEFQTYETEQQCDAKLCDVWSTGAYKQDGELHPICVNVDIVCSERDSKHFDTKPECVQALPSN